MDIKNELNSINKMAQKEYNTYYEKVSSKESIIYKEEYFIRIQDYRKDLSKKEHNWKNDGDKPPLSTLTVGDLNNIKEILYYISLFVVIGIFTIYVQIAPYIPLNTIEVTIIGVLILLFLICDWLYLLLFSSKNRLKKIEDKIIMFFINRSAKKKKMDFKDIIKYYFDKDLNEKYVSKELCKIVRVSKLFDEKDRKNMMNLNKMYLIKLLNITSSIENYEYFKSTHKIKENLVVQNNEK